MPQKTNQQRGGVRRPPPANVTGNGRPKQKTVTRFGWNRTGGRRHQGAWNPATRKYTTPWFVAASGSISGEDTPRVICQSLLHPNSFGGTPYADACKHYTMRRELNWRFQIRITCATTTGTRMCFSVIQDPSWNGNQMTPEYATNMVSNGQGTEVTATAATTRSTRFSVRGPTRNLSNAAPAENNLLGYAAGVLNGYLLNPPIALAGGSVLQWTLSAQVDLLLINPSSGFGDFTTSNPDTPVHPHVAWTINIGNVQSAMPDTWVNSHNASVWLDGGNYLHIPSKRPQLLNTTLTSGGTSISGNPLTFAVYTMNVVTQHWQNDYKNESPQPTYFVTWHEPASGVLQMVGFTNLQDARNMAGGHTGLVRQGHQYSLHYNWPTEATQKQWDYFFEFTGSSQFIGVGQTNGVITDRSGMIAFSLVEQTKSSQSWYDTSGRVGFTASQALLNPEQSDDDEWSVGVPEELVESNGYQDFQMDQLGRSLLAGPMSKEVGTTQHLQENQSLNKLASAHPSSPTFMPSSLEQQIVVDCLGTSSFQLAQELKKLCNKSHWFCSKSHPNSSPCKECRQLWHMELINSMQGLTLSEQPELAPIDSSATSAPPTPRSTAL